MFAGWTSIGSSNRFSFYPKLIGSYFGGRMSRKRRLAVAKKKGYDVRHLSLISINSAGLEIQSKNHSFIGGVLAVIILQTSRDNAPTN